MTATHNIANIAMNRRALFASQLMDGGDESAAIEEEFEDVFEVEYFAGLEKCEIAL